jgi:hypothetical protein
MRNFPAHAPGLQTAARAAALASLLLAGPLTAGAAVVSGSLSFTAWDFTPAGAPVDPISGTVTYSFDNSATFTNVADGGTANGAPVSVSFSGLTLPGSWVPVLTYFTVSPIGQADVMAIGNGPTTIVTGGTDDWRFAARDISTTPLFREFVYASSSIPEVVFTSLTGSVAAVPEPGALALFSLGLAVLGARGWRRRR